MRLAAAACAAALLALGAGPAAASPSQESVFMDDPALVYGTQERVERTLDTVRALGFERVRVSLYWGLVAPDPGSKERPRFRAQDAAAYPRGAWERYERVVREARRRGLRVLFSLTGPAPLWATGTPRRRSIEPTYTPSAAHFRDFAEAAGRRFPEVDSWSVWNEPNHPGWLTPQWLRDPRGGGRPQVAAAAIVYRGLVDAAWRGLAAAGHEGDEFLIGELAPRGWDKRGLIQAMRPLEFLRELYCLDPRGRPYRGEEAALRFCLPGPGRFAATHPGLFEAAGLAHHPYDFARPPAVPDEHPDNAPLASLRRLTAVLDRAFRARGRPGGLPVYFTEYGYQTDPPDPGGVTPARQAAWLAEAEYLAYRSPRVATVAQFLLRDDGPLPGRRGARRWGSFQTGLMFADGRPKPALRAFARPLHVRPAPGGARVFARLRGARGPLRARIEARPQRGGPYRVVREVTTHSPYGFLLARVRLRAPSVIRVAWLAPADGSPLRTRAVRVGRTR